MAQKKKQKKASEPNVSLLLFILALCVVIIVVTVTVTSLNKGGDGEDSSHQTSSADRTQQTDTDTKKPDETGGDTSEGTADSTEDSDELTNTDTESDTDTDTETDTDGQTTADSGEIDIGYEVEAKVESKKTDGGEVTIIYPTVKSKADKIDADKLNSLIKRYIDEKFEECGLSDSGGEYSYEITETDVVLATEKLISVIVKGIYYTSEDASPTVFAYTVNCDIKASSIIPSSDLVYDFDKLKSLFVGGKFKLEEGLKTLLDETNYGDMIMEYRAEYGIYPNVYFTPDGFGMVIDLVYTLGGYALFEIPYSELGGAALCPID